MLTAELTDKSGVRQGSTWLLLKSMWPGFVCDGQCLLKLTNISNDIKTRLSMNV